MARWPLNVSCCAFILEPYCFHEFLLSFICSSWLLSFSPTNPLVISVIVVILVGEPTISFVSDNEFCNIADFSS